MAVVALVILMQDVFICGVFYYVELVLQVTDHLLLLKQLLSIVQVRVAVHSIENVSVQSAIYVLLST